MVAVRSVPLSAAVSAKRKILLEAQTSRQGRADLTRIVGAWMPRRSDRARGVPCRDGVGESGARGDGSGEGAAAEVVAEWSRAAGLRVEVDEVLPGRPNVLVTAPGTGGGRTLLLNGHLDTVGVTGMERPVRRGRREGRLYGRGAYDMKGALAAALVAAARATGEARGRCRRRVRHRRGARLRRDRAAADVANRRRRDRLRADRRAGLRRAQGLRRLRGRDTGPRRPRLAAGSRCRRDRGDGAGADPAPAAWPTRSGRGRATRSWVPARSMPR